jgi:hypothetical protein
MSDPDWTVARIEAAKKVVSGAIPIRFPNYALSSAIKQWYKTGT